MFAQLMQKLVELGRTDDARRAVLEHAGSFVRKPGTYSHL
jgi:hypothetical protein